MNYAPRNLLITGGAGFIGANFVRHWLDRSQEGRVVVLDALTYAGNQASLAGLERDPRFVFVRGDICDEALTAALLRQHAIDTIVHFAAESHVDRSILGPDDFIRTNVVGTHALLKVARDYWLRERGGAPHRFHHVSTDEVYGSLLPGEPAFQESTPYAPNSPYSASKAGSDHLVRAYHATYGLQTTTTNCSNNYGPYQFPEKLIPLLIVNILSGKSLPVYGDGLQVRDWLYVRDHCRAIELTLNRGAVGEVYNIGGEGEINNMGLVRMLCAAMDEYLEARPALTSAFANSPVALGASSTGLIRSVADRPGHDRRYAVNFSKARAHLGYAPSVDLMQGLRITIDWYMSNVSWWRALLGRDYDGWLAANYADRSSS
jgi:dTDP-glucose 4,6-dehydratase